MGVQISNELENLVIPRGSTAVKKCFNSRNTSNTEKCQVLDTPERCPSVRFTKEPTATEKGVMILPKLGK